MVSPPPGPGLSSAPLVTSSVPGSPEQLEVVPRQRVTYHVVLFIGQRPDAAYRSGIGFESRQSLSGSADEVLRLGFVPDHPAGAVNPGVEVFGAGFCAQWSGSFDCWTWYG